MKSADEQSFIAFVEARRDHLRRIAFAIAGDWHAADDVLQEALVKLYLAWPRVRRDGHEEAYARRIIVRSDIDRRRRPWRREQFGDVPEAPHPDSMERVGDRDAVFQALQQLPLMQRKVVLLRHWLDLSVEQTAAELDIREGTVKSHSARGLAALRQLIPTDDSEIVRTERRTS